MFIYRIKSKQNYPQNYQKDNRESTEKSKKKKKKIFQRRIKIENKIGELKLYMIITIINVNELTYEKKNTQMCQTNRFSLQKPQLKPEVEKTQCW